MIVWCYFLSYLSWCSLHHVKDGGEYILLVVYVRFVELTVFICPKRTFQSLLYIRSSLYTGLTTAEGPVGLQRWVRCLDAYYTLIEHTSICSSEPSWWPIRGQEILILKIVDAASAISRTVHNPNNCVRMHTLLLTDTALSIIWQQMCYYLAPLSLYSVPAPPLSQFWPFPFAETLNSYAFEIALQNK